MKKATKGVHVTSRDNLIEELRELVSAGEMTVGQAERLVGALAFEVAGVELGSRTTRWRRRKEMAEVGLVLEDGLLEQVTVDLGQHLEEVFEIPFG